MKREVLELNKYTLACIMEWGQEEDAGENQALESKDFELIEDTILSSDPDDGGYDAEAIIRRISDNKFFKLKYQEWDFNWEYGHFDDYEPELIEVFPKNITKIVYD